MPPDRGKKGVTHISKRRRTKAPFSFALFKQDILAEQKMSDEKMVKWKDIEKDSLILAPLQNKPAVSKHVIVEAIISNYFPITVMCLLH